MERWALILICFAVSYARVNGEKLECLEYLYKSGEYCLFTNVTVTNKGQSFEIGTIKNKHFNNTQSNLTIKSILFQHGNIEYIPEEIFTKFPSMNHILLDKTQIVNITENFFEHGSQLTNIEIVFSPINEISAYAFENATNLRRLYLPFNEIENIHSDAFGTLYKLSTLDLSFNKLKSIDPLWFQDLNTLVYLILKGNQIQKISDELFINTPQIGILDISKNKITDLNMTFSTMSQLKEINLSCMKKDNEYSNDDYNVLNGLTTLKIINETNCGQCEIPLVENATTSLTEEDILDRWFTRVKFVCDNNGTFLSTENAEEEWTCINGIWDKTLPYCRTGCPKLKDLGNTIDATCNIESDEISCYSKLVIGTTVSIKCKSGYKPVNDNGIQNDLLCLESGKWNNTPYNCEPENLKNTRKNTKQLSFNNHKAIV